ncbi:hypothetical protein Mapa_010649 [Marchantia paleacea]|nr:hypothetical protein Mapa_010649 [Marchantia paleacea]
MVLSTDIDLLQPPAELEKRKHKLKRLVQSPNSFFMVRISFCSIVLAISVVYRTSHLGGGGGEGRQSL